MKKQGNAKEYMSFDDAVPVLIRLCAIMVPIMAVIMGLLVTNRLCGGFTRAYIRRQVGCDRYIRKRKKGR